MKTMKKLASVFFAVIMCFAMFAFTSCGDKEKTYTAYEFTLIYEDGNPAEGYSVQLCTIDEAGMCFQPVKANAEGKVTYTPSGFPGAGVYEIHILDSKSARVEFEGEAKTADTFDAYTLTIKK